MKWESWGLPAVHSDKIQDKTAAGLWNCRGLFEKMAWNRNRYLENNT